MLKLSRALTLLFLVLIFLFSIGFSFFNTEPIALSFGFFVLPAQPLALWVLSGFVLGGMLGLALGAGIFRKWRNEREIKRLRTELLQAQLQSSTSNQVKQATHAG